MVITNVCCKYLEKQSWLILIALFFAMAAVAGEPGAGNSGENGHALSLQGSNQSNLVFIPGDAVSISTLPDSTSLLNNVFPIDDRGYVELPVYGKTKISHMTRDQFVAFIREQYKDELIYPNIQVKPMIRISVLGGVPRPGFYYFDEERSLWEVMYEVGGTMDENGLKEMRWKRSGKNVEENLIPSLQTGISLKRMGFRSGDQIWVKSPNKPGKLERARSYLTFVTAAASALTLYITYQRFIVRGN